jgi:hypothetical protein
MRWWLSGLAMLVVLSITLTLLHPRKQTLGEQLLRTLDRQEDSPPLPLRGAIELIDYEPSAVDLAGIQTGLWKQGEGALPGMGMPPRPNNRWLTGPGIQLTWQISAGTLERGSRAPVDPLRGALVSPSRAEQSVRFALAGEYPPTVEEALTWATSSLTELSDEALVKEWLKADRAILAEKDDLHSAVREILLLKARPVVGPVVVFASAGERVYLVPIESPERYENPAFEKDAWVEMDCYRGTGQLAWSGVLQVSGTTHAPEPSRVRAIAARIALELEKSPASSSAPAMQLRPAGR